IGATWSQSGSDPSSVSFTTPLNGGRRIGSALRSIDSWLTPCTSGVLRGRELRGRGPGQAGARPAITWHVAAGCAPPTVLWCAQRRRATRRDVLRAPLRVASMLGFFGLCV